MERLIGTDFQKMVWKELSKIPLGETRTYSEIAELIGRPKSFRAVTNACASNPYPLEIPCHRVVRSDGSPGGYSAEGGEREKVRLIMMEKSMANNEG